MLHECAFLTVASQHCSVPGCVVSRALLGLYSCSVQVLLALLVNLACFSLSSFVAWYQGHRKIWAVLFFHGCVGGTARRIPLVPASEKNQCRQAGSSYPAVAGKCMRSEHFISSQEFAKVVTVTRRILSPRQTHLLSLLVEDGWSFQSRTVCIC